MGAFPAADKILATCWLLMVPDRLCSEYLLFKQISTEFLVITGGSSDSPVGDEVALGVGVGVVAAGVVVVAVEVGNVGVVGTGGGVVLVPGVAVIAGELQALNRLDPATTSNENNDRSRRNIRRLISCRSGLPVGPI
jgi:hypothetical protein